MMDLDKGLFSRVQDKLLCQQNSENEDADSADLIANMDDKITSSLKHPESESETSPRQQHDNIRDANNSIILIPDTPSPVFSRFVGKNSQRSNNVNTKTKDQGEHVQNGYHKKYSLSFSFTNPEHETPNSCSRESTFPQMHKTNMQNTKFFYDPSRTTSKGSNFDSSNRTKPDETFTLSSRPSKMLTDTRSSVKINLAQDNQNEMTASSTSDVDRLVTDDTAREIALEKIKAVRNRRAAQKRYFQDVVNCEDGTEYSKQAKKRNESYSYSKFSNETFGSGTVHSVVDSNLDLRNDDRISGNCYRQSESQSSRLSENSCNSKYEEGNRTSRDGAKLSPRIDSRQDGTESVSRQTALEKLKIQRERKKIKLLGDKTSTACKDSYKKDSAETIPKKFTSLCWPSESESDSDCSDCIPLREILSSNKSDKKKMEEKSNCGQTVKKHSVFKKQDDSVSNDLSLDECASAQDNQHGGDIPKTPNRVKVLRSSSVISISSDDSIDQLYGDCISDSQLEQIMSDDFIPPISSRPDATYTVNRPTSTGDYLNFRSVRHNIDDLDMPSVDHPSNCCYDSHLTSSDPTEHLLLQSSQVSSTGGLVNTARNRVRTSGPNIPKRSRSSTNSVKGRAIRSRTSRHAATDVPVSPEVLGGAVGFTPASSLRRRHSRGEVDPVTVVQQLENDEEYARKLQEEMDLEFAMSLHNMENTPPPQPYIGAPHDHFTETQDIHSHHLIPQQSRHPVVQRGRHNPRRSDNIGIDELEALLDTTDDSLPFVQMPMVTSPPRLRSRSQRSRSQRSQNNLNAIANRETSSYITSLINASAGFPITASRWRGRRGSFFSNNPLFRSPGIAVDDYEGLLNLADMLGDVKEKGISQAEAARLPKRKFQTRNNPDDLEECMICMCEYVTGDDLRILPCFHEFHAPCIDKWLNGNATCPICRVEVRIG